DDEGLVVVRPPEGQRSDLGCRAVKVHARVLGTAGVIDHDLQVVAVAPGGNSDVVDDRPARGISVHAEGLLVHVQHQVVVSAVGEDVVDPAAVIGDARHNADFAIPLVRDAVHVWYASALAAIGDDAGNLTVDKGRPAGVAPGCRVFGDALRRDGDRDGASR